jgi:hypothetical protein
MDIFYGFVLGLGIALVALAAALRLKAGVRFDDEGGPGRRIVALAWGARSGCAAWSPPAE